MSQGNEADTEENYLRAKLNDCEELNKALTFELIRVNRVNTEMTSAYLQQARLCGKLQKDLDQIKSAVDMQPRSNQTRMPLPQQASST